MNFKELLGTKGFDELVDEAKERLKADKSRVTNWNIGGVFRSLTEVAMRALADLHELVARVAPMGFARWASGAWLDAKVEDVGLTRRPAVHAVHRVRFFRTEPGDTVVIPEGTIVKTQTGSDEDELRFFTTQPARLLAGETEVWVEARAEFEGARYNVGAGAIRSMVTHIPGVNGVTNDADSLVVAGADREDDESLRERYFLRWQELATGSTREAYISWAKSVPGVRDVEVDDDFPRGQGTVDVIVASEGGPPPQSLLDEVARVIAERKPLTANVLVKAPTIIETPVRMRILAPATAGDENEIISEVTARIRALSSRMGIGRTLYRSSLIAEAKQVEHVLDAVPELPVDNVGARPEDLVVITSIDVIVERESAP